MVILDVREKEEFEAMRIPGSILCPLSQFDLLAPAILKNLKDSDVVVMCRSGNRARLALNDLKKLDLNNHNITVFDGGIVRWKQEGKPVVEGKKTAIPIFRQVLMVASTMLIAGFMLALFVNPSFLYLSYFVGVGLAVAGFTGICPMMAVLKMMPWNKDNTCELNKEVPGKACF